MSSRRSLEPLRYGPRRREYVWMALALVLLLWYAVGGDRPEDRILDVLPADGRSASAQMLCPKLRDGLFLRWQIEHRRETGFNWHRCAYGPIWLETARQEGM